MARRAKKNFLGVNLRCKKDFACFLGKKCRICPSFEVCCCCCAVVEDDIDTFAAAAAAAVGNHATCLYPLKYRVCRCRDQGIFAFYGG